MRKFLYTIGVAGLSGTLAGVAAGKMVDSDEQAIARAFVRGLGYGECAEALRRGDIDCEPRVNGIAIEVANSARTDRYEVVDGVLKDGAGERVDSVPERCTSGEGDTHDTCDVAFID